MNEEKQNMLHEALIKAFPEAQVFVKDMMGDGNHFDIKVASHLFKNKTIIEQHKMVHSALGDLMKQIHAIAINTSDEFVENN